MLSCVVEFLVLFKDLQDKDGTCYKKEICSEDNKYEYYNKYCELFDTDPVEDKGQKINNNENKYRRNNRSRLNIVKSRYRFRTYEFANEKRTYLVCNDTENTARNDGDNTAHKTLVEKNFSDMSLLHTKTVIKTELRLSLLHKKTVGIYHQDKRKDKKDYFWLRQKNMRPSVNMMKKHPRSPISVNILGIKNL